MHGADCTKIYLNIGHLYRHCKEKHECQETYGSCPNVREYRAQKYHASHGDTQSIERYLAEGFLRCDHSQCIYFFKTECAKHSHMYQRHVCSNPHGCEACVIRNFHIDNGENNSDDQDQSHSNGGRRGRLLNRQRKVISGTAVSYKKRSTTTNSTLAKPCQAGDWNERMFNLIKCPHVGCEEFGQPSVINQHLRLDHTCPVSLHFDGCQLSRHSEHQHDWLLV
ncbi:hypothetical protein SAMD00019534_049550 [Acytostelium subglobosum LB1]|uniref:hypothetical protein n=1 Tax=Acytostelium subglobosum LB1 TaxID=1410327 RepID=UPI000644E20A|nr:hypothetical protein SAMD00019534_049550 [Acytostelium subglobosum LB1]GAM21780.1 hypothetical protein SAMD00019534_049550 [Acytostelium subglobosum LB1]|eukprot:XP_012754880.1 hypothetical protein SAMD00019534_049550 [Acytostelium subglobosum LB1]